MNGSHFAGACIGALLAGSPPAAARTGTDAEPATAPAPAPPPAAAPAAPPNQASAPVADGVGDIIVTAQKRAQSINDVPVSITATTGDQLVRQGVVDVQGLVKVVPGFNAIDSGYGTPVYFLRGIGFFDSSIAAKPTVGVYIDEAPIPFSIMTPGASFDLERVEVLKGPQGTLFGQNATGGAINYIAAKPTRELEYGGQASYGRFDRTVVEGYVSGPVTGTLSARIAVQHEGGSDWQRSFTHDDSLGARDFAQGRIILAWKPVSGLRINAALNWNVDRSDTQAPQFVTPFQQTAGSYFNTILSRYPMAPADNRAADWGRTVQLRRDNHMMQNTLRIDYDLSSKITMTSLSSYALFHERYGQDADGTVLKLADIGITGDIHAFTQELRLGGSLPGNGNWLVGGNYERSTANELVDQFLNDQTSGHTFDRFGLPAIIDVPQQGSTQYRSKAAFASITAPVLARLSATAGIRYTDTQIDFQGCLKNGGNGTYGKAFETILRLPAGTFPLDACATLNTANLPGRFSGALPENNVSWRGALEWKPSGDQLFYASVSRGFKAGSYANLPATSFGQYAPVRQEKVTAYEIGFKSSFADRHVQLNGALFYYDYVDKQLKGRTIVPIFGPLEALLNVPKSRVQGAEVQIDVVPLTGLRASVGATYIDTKVKGSFTNYTAFGVSADFNGRAFPFTPKWQINGDIEYGWSIGGRKRAYLGGNLSSRSSTNGDFVPDARLFIKSYALLDLRAGMEADDGVWRVSLYGRNVTNTYYYSTAARRSDSIVRYAGMPVTYGVAAQFRFR